MTRVALLSLSACQQQFTKLNQNQKKTPTHPQQAVGFADFNTVKDATNDPSCTETGSSIVIDAVNNPFVEDDIIFGGVGPYDVYSFNGATIQGTGHRVTTNGGVTFSGLVFDGAGASATIMEGTNLQNATFLHCTFKEARVGLLAVSAVSYTHLTLPTTPYV